MCFLCKNNLIAKTIRVMFIVKKIIPIIGKDPNIAKLKSFQNRRNASRLLTATDTKYNMPEAFV